MYFYKIGKFVFVRYNGNLNLTNANTFITLGQIPAGFLPVEQLNITYAQINNGVKGIGRVNFYPSGKIDVYAQLPGLYEAKFCVSYITS